MYDEANPNNYTKPLHFRHTDATNPFKYNEPVDFGDGINPCGTLSRISVDSNEQRMHHSTDLHNRPFLVDNFAHANLNQFILPSQNYCYLPTQNTCYSSIPQFLPSHPCNFCSFTAVDLMELRHHQTIYHNISQNDYFHTQYHPMLNIQNSFVPTHIPYVIPGSNQPIDKSMYIQKTMGPSHSPVFNPNFSQHLHKSAESRYGIFKHPDSEVRHPRKRRHSFTLIHSTISSRNVNDKKRIQNQQNHHPSKKFCNNDPRNRTNISNSESNFSNSNKNHAMNTNVNSFIENSNLTNTSFPGKPKSSTLIHSDHIENDHLKNSSVKSPLLNTQSNNLTKKKENVDMEDQMPLSNHSNIDSPTNSNRERVPSNSVDSTTHNTKKIIPCIPCNVEFYDELSYENHCKFHIKCSYQDCNYTAKKNLVISHENTFHKMISLIQDPNVQELIGPNQTELICKPCSVSFPTESQFLDHKRKHIKCSFCDFEAKKTAVKDHERINHPNRSVDESIRSSLSQNQNSSENISSSSLITSKFICKECMNVSFLNEKELLNHIKYHIKCSFPGCSFEARKLIVAAHEKDVHNIQTTKSNNAPYNRSIHLDSPEASYTDLTLDYKLENNTSIGIDNYKKENILESSMDAIEESVKQEQKEEKCDLNPDIQEIHELVSFLKKKNQDDE